MIVIVIVIVRSFSKVVEISKSDRSQKSTASRIPRDGFPSDLMLTWFCHIISL